MKADRGLYAKEFIDRAKEDLGVARTLLKEGEFFESSCFHCQQAAEKYLKAFLIKKDVRFKKIHDLEQLIEMCSGVDKEFTKILPAARFLNPYYIGSRYPDVFGSDKEANQKEAKKALRSAEEIVSFVEPKL